MNTELELKEPKTPLRRPKRGKRRKERDDDHDVEVFMSYETTCHFSQYKDDVDPDDNDDSFAVVNSYNIETKVDEWLLTRDVYRSVVSKKKDVFFEAKRERVNSMSYTDNVADNDSTEQSVPIRNLTPVSLQISPQNSKIKEKRSKFSCSERLDICMSPLLKVDTINFNKNIQSEQKMISHGMRLPENQDGPGHSYKIRSDDCRPLDSLYF